jgi:hypothetical protein
MAGRRSEWMVAAFVREQLKRSGRSVNEVAAGTNLHPAMLKMIIAGSTRLPLDGIEPLARTLKFDAIELLRVVLKQSMPESSREFASVWWSSF